MTDSQLPADPTPPDAVATNQDENLEFLVHLANTSGLEAGVTITVEGLVISGTLVGGEPYFRGLADAVQGQDEPESVRGTLAEWLRKTAEWYGDDRTNEDEEDAGPIPPLAFIHLKEANIFTPGAPPLPLGLWRGRLDAVSGWAFASLSMGDAGK